MAASPFAVVDQFIALRDGLGTASLGPLPEMRAPEISPGGSLRYGAAPGGAPVGGNIAARWDAFRKNFPGLRQTSGYRDPEHNRRVGGVPNSKHTRAHNPAMDFVGSARDMQAGAAWAKLMGASEVLIHNAGSGQHLHVAWD